MGRLLWLPFTSGGAIAPDLRFLGELLTTKAIVRAPSPRVARSPGKRAFDIFGSLPQMSSQSRAANHLSRSGAKSAIRPGNRALCDLYRGGLRCKDVISWPVRPGFWAPL